MKNRKRGRSDFVPWELVFVVALHEKSATPSRVSLFKTYQELLGSMPGVVYMRLVYNTFQTLCIQTGNDGEAQYKYFDPSFALWHCYSSGQWMRDRVWCKIRIKIEPAGFMIDRWFSHVVVSRGPPEGADFITVP